MDTKELKQKLLVIPNLKRKSGAISVSKRRGTAYYLIRQSILYHTKHMDDTVNMTERIQYILHDCKPKLCKCGCGQPVKLYKHDYLLNHHFNTVEFKEHTKKVMLEKYGVDNPSKSDVIKNKKKQTSLKKYGTTSHMKSVDGYNKFKKSMKEKCGYENPFQNPEVGKKIRQKYIQNKDSIIKKRIISHRKNFYTNLFNTRLKDKVEPLFDMCEYTSVNKLYPFKCKKCGYKFISNLDNGKIPRCLQCYPLINKKAISDTEIEINDFVSKYNPTNISCRSIIYPYELDIYIPSKNIAIEYNGLYWHSEQNGKDKSYHLNKTELCESRGIRLIHIFEDEWMYKEQIVKNRLKSILGETNYSIYARKCEVRVIDNSTARQFVDKYHIQGYMNSSIRLGLFYNNRMVACMMFGKRRFDKQVGYELMRYCTVANFRVLGGAGKLLKYFERNWNPTTLISYADRRWSQGGVYKSLGFEFVRNSAPNYWYFNKDTPRLNRWNYQKFRLTKKLKKYDETLTELGNMINNGYNRIWDCGNMVFEKKYQ